jgi:hypothetical protein
MLELQPVRHRFVDCRAIAGADRFALRAPGGDLSRGVRIACEPGRDRFLPIGRQFAVHIGMQLIFSDGQIVFRHRFTFEVISRGAAPGARRRGRI